MSTNHLSFSSLSGQEKEYDHHREKTPSSLKPALFYTALVAQDSALRSLLLICRLLMNPLLISLILLSIHWALKT